MRRRDFLKTAAAATAISALTPSQSLSQIHSLNGKKKEHPRLPALRQQVKPITPEERNERQEKARKLMSEFNIDALLFEGGVSLNYFTGVLWGRSDRLFAMILPKKGAPQFIAPKIEEPRALEQIGSAKLYLWEEHENPYELVKQVLTENNVRTGTLGVEETTRHFVIEGIAAATPSIKIVSATPVTAGCRSVKSPHEIELMQIANEVTMEIFKLIPTMLTENVIERMLARSISQTFAMHGFQGGAFVLFGTSTAQPYATPKDNTLKVGDIILVNGGCSIEGYMSDITRTMVFLDKPTEKMSKVFDIVKKAQSAALATAQPGTPAEDVDTAARKVIENAGYGPGYKYFKHRVGHGIGLEQHEWHYLVRGNKQRIAVGNIFTNEPGIYLAGEFGIRLEDQMLITDSGPKLLLPQAETLEDFFGVKI